MLVLIESNHLPAIKKQPPVSVEKQLSSLSQLKETSEETAPHYEQQLPNRGYKQKLTYDDPMCQNQIMKKKFQRNTLWFNTLQQLSQNKNR